MAKPSPDWDMVTLKWAGRYLDGTPATGKITLDYEGTSPLLDDHTTLPVSIFKKQITLPLEERTFEIDFGDGPEEIIVGYCEVAVPATNDPDITGSGGTYAFTENLDKVEGRKKVSFVADKDVPEGVIWLNKVPGTEPQPGTPLSVVYWSDFSDLTDRVEFLEEFGGGGEGEGGGAVFSVNGQIGTVVLDAEDVGARPATWFPTWTQVTGKPTEFTPAAHNHDDLYYTQLQVDDLLENLESDEVVLTSYTDQVASLNDYPSEFPAEYHVHEIADVSTLQGILNGKQDAGDYATLTQLNSGLAGKAATSHNHAISDITGLEDALDNAGGGDYAPVIHTHAISDVTDLQNALDGKADIGEAITPAQLSAATEGFLEAGDPAIPAFLSDLSDIDTTSASDGDTLVFDMDTDSWGPGTPAQSASVNAENIVGTLNLEQVAPGTTITVDYSRAVYGAQNAWPSTRPTARTDVVIVWQGPTDPGLIAISSDVINLTG